MEQRLSLLEDKPAPLATLAARQQIASARLNSQGETELVVMEAAAALAG
jgi:hypothetical protein